MADQLNKVLGVHPPFWIEWFGNVASIFWRGDNQSTQRKISRSKGENQRQIKNPRVASPEEASFVGSKCSHLKNKFKKSQK